VKPPDAPAAPLSREPRVLLRFAKQWRSPAGTINAEEIAGVRASVAARLVAAGVAKALPGESAEELTGRAIPSEGDPRLVEDGSEPDFLTVETASEPAGEDDGSEADQEPSAPAGEPENALGNASESVSPDAPTCRSCGRLIDRERRRGSPRRFCSARCRLRAWKIEGPA
jgi:hypothetical protein